MSSLIYKVGDTIPIISRKGRRTLQYPDIINGERVTSIRWGGRGDNEAILSNAQGDVLARINERTRKVTAVTTQAERSSYRVPGVEFHRYRGAEDQYQPPRAAKPNHVWAIIDGRWKEFGAGSSGRTVHNVLAGGRRRNITVETDAHRRKRERERQKKIASKRKETIRSIADRERRIANQNQQQSIPQYEIPSTPGECILSGLAFCIFCKLRRYSPLFPSPLVSVRIPLFGLCSPNSFPL